MITIKLPYKTEDYTLIKEIIREQTIIKKWSYNRFKEGKSEKEIRLLSKSLKNIKDLDSWFIESSMYDGKGVWKIGKANKIIFNKYNFIRRQKRLISREEYQLTQNNYLYSIGSKRSKGNRKFELQMENNQILFKPKKGIKIYLTLPNLRNNVKQQLIQLALLSKQKILPVTYKLDLSHVYIMFDETILNQYKEITKLKENRIMGIDLNPNYIGLSILEFNGVNYNVIKKLCYNISKLTGKKDNHNKLRHETIEITNKIINLAKHWKVKHIGVEDLNIKGKDHEKGRNYNSLVINKWLRNLFQQQLGKRCNVFGIKFLKANSYYSSYIGNLQHDSFDPINASIEIGRRAYEVMILKNKQFYPEFGIKDELMDQWKESINNVSEWKELFTIIKNLKLKYRISLDDVKTPPNVFRMNSITSKVLINDFV